MNLAKVIISLKELEKGNIFWAYALVSMAFSEVHAGTHPMSSLGAVSRVSSEEYFSRRERLPDALENPLEKHIFQSFRFRIFLSLSHCSGPHRFGQNKSEAFPIPLFLSVFISSIRARLETKDGRIRF